MTALSFFEGIETGAAIDGNGGNSQPPARRLSFADAVATRYHSPLDIAHKFHYDAQAAALAIGVQLPDAIDFSGAWAYASNAETGKDDKRQGYIAEIRQRGDGLIRPVITISTFRGGSNALQWCPDNLLWDEHTDSGAIHQAHDPEKYRAQAAKLAEEHAAKRAQRERNDAAGQAVVAMTAAKVLEAAQDCTQHEYLTSKGIGSHGAKIATQRITGTLYNQLESETFEGTACDAGDLLIPLYKDGELVSVQRIRPDGSKRFLMGGVTAGAYYLIKGTSDAPAFVTEGFATGATVFEATGRSVYVAFSAYNLKAVADANQDIGAVAADANDAGIKGAKATGLPHYAPPDTTGGDDWNDYAQLKGVGMAAEVLQYVDMKQRDAVPSASIPNGWELAADAKAARYLVDGLLEEDAHGILGGASMTYKTFKALRLAHSICSGKPFAGRKVYRKGAVVYVCGEGQGAINRRLKALLIKHGQPEHAIHVITGGVALNCSTSMAALLEQIKPLEPVLVIFDTFASLSGGIDENSNSEVGEALNLVRDTCRVAGASSLIVHHFGKNADQGFRGASAFTNNVDYAFMAHRRGADNSRESGLACHKMKDGEPFREIFFKSDIVPLGIYDQKGQETASLVAEHDEHGASDAPLTHEDIMLRELDRLQKEAPITNAKEDPTWITWKDWQAAISDYGISNPRRTRGNLIDKGQVAEKNRKYRAV